MKLEAGKYYETKDGSIAKIYAMYEYDVRTSHGAICVMGMGWMVWQWDELESCTYANEKTEQDINYNIVKVSDCITDECAEGKELKKFMEEMKETK